MSADIDTTRKRNVHDNFGLQLNDVASPVRSKMSSERRKSGGGCQDGKFSRLSNSKTKSAGRGRGQPASMNHASAPGPVSAGRYGKPKASVVTRKSPSSKPQKNDVTSIKPSSGKRGSSQPAMRGAPIVNGDLDFCYSDDDDDGDGQDVLFYNVPSEREKEENNRREKKYQTITEELIFDSAQESDRHQVYEIMLHASGIRKISSLEKFTKCRVLDLSCNYIENIENMEQLQDLRELKLYDNQIKSLTNLDCLKELVHLQLQHNQIKNLGRGLVNLKKLSQLRLDHNYLARLEGKEITSCSQLTMLDLSNNKLDTIVALNCLPNLEELQVANNRLKVVQDLTRCRKLQEIDLSGNKLTDVSGLKGLPTLMVLNVSRNNLFNLKSVGKLRSLQELNISYNKVMELSSLVHQFPNLEVFNASNNNIEKWEEMCALRKLSVLVELFTNNNPVFDGATQKTHQDLKLLLPSLDMLDGCQLKKLTPRSAAPIMRPMSASTIISSRQVECQLKMVEDEISAFEVDMTRKFESLLSSMSTLPAEAPNRPDTAISRSISTAGSRAASSRRSRIAQAQEFAAENF